jgi:hypothetical protein
MRKAILVGVFALTGCFTDDREEDGPCTLVGCTNALSVTLTHPPAEPYRVEATAGTDTRSQNCAMGVPCPVHFFNFLPARATINVVAASGTATYDVIPLQSTSQPNGPRCGPTCTRASVTVSGSLGAVSVYKSAGSVQCSGGGLTPAQMQIELTAAGIGVISAACGADGTVVLALCGAADTKINIFEVQASDVAAAQGLGFALLSGLPDAARKPCS